MTQVFVSYCQPDEAFAIQLADDLRTTGARVWLDVRDAEPGRNWTRSIERALSESSMMIVVLSPDALLTSHVAVEWQAYVEAHRPVIPVVARPCALPGPLRTRQPIDFTRPAGHRRAFHQLSMRLIEHGMRRRRSDPVIWTMAETVQDFRDEHAPAPPRADPVETADDAGADGGLQRMVRGLRDLLRRGNAPTSA